MRYENEPMYATEPSTSRNESSISIDYNSDITVPICAGIYARTLADNDKIYFCSLDSNFYCASKYDGSLLWKFKTAGPITSSPFLYKSRLYFGSDDGHLYCISNDGKLMWKFITGNRIISSPAVADNVVYFGSNDMKFYAIDAETGKQLWSFITGDVIVGSPAISGNCVYFGSYDHYFYCLDKHTGRLMWKFFTGSHIGATPLIVDEFNKIVSRPPDRVHSTNIQKDGSIHIGSIDGNHYCLALDGELKWKFLTNYAVATCPNIYNNIIFFGSYDRYFYALNAKNGNFIWRFLTNAGMESWPAIKDGRIFFGSLDGYLYALDISGFLKWKFLTNGGVNGSPLIDENYIYAGSFDGYLYKLTLDGDLVWKFLTGTGLPPFKPSNKTTIIVEGATKEFIPIWKPETTNLKGAENTKNYTLHGDNSMVTYGSAFSGDAYKIGNTYKQNKGAYNR